jgi:hypothetical protein
MEGSNARKVVIANSRTAAHPRRCISTSRIRQWLLLDDGRSVKDETWTLSLILKYGWNSGNQHPELATLRGVS